MTLEATFLMTKYWVLVKNEDQNDPISPILIDYRLPVSSILFQYSLPVFGLNL